MVVAERECEWEWEWRGWAWAWEWVAESGERKVGWGGGSMGGAVSEEEVVSEWRGCDCEFDGESALGTVRFDMGLGLRFEVGESTRLEEKRKDTIREVVVEV